MTARKGRNGVKNASVWWLLLCLLSPVQLAHSENKQPLHITSGSFSLQAVGRSAKNSQVGTSTCGTFTAVASCFLLNAGTTSATPVPASRGHSSPASLWPRCLPFCCCSYSESRRVVAHLCGPESPASVLWETLLSHCVPVESAGTVESTGGLCCVDSGVLSCQLFLLSLSTRCPASLQSPALLLGLLVSFCPVLLSASCGAEREASHSFLPGLAKGGRK